MSSRDVTSTDAIARAERRAQAVELRSQGLTLRQIAERLNVAVATVHADIERALSDVPAENVETLRAVWGDRLDQGVHLIMESIKDGNLDAVDKLVRLTDRAAKLYGLDSPKQVEMTGVDLDLDAAVRDLMNVMNRPPVDHAADPRFLDYEPHETKGDE